MAVRAIAVWGNIWIVVDFWMALAKFKQPSKENKSYIRLKAATTDSLMLAKIKFFASNAQDRSFSSMFLLKDTLIKANTCLRLSNLHFKDRTIQKHGKDVDPGISVKLELADVKKNG